MPKQLLVMRHAKSSWTNANATDHQRPLNGRGQRDAPRMGRWIADQNCVPDLILSSTATRAVETAKLFVQNCAGVEHDRVQFIDEFYHAAPRVYLDHLSRTCDDSIQRAMLVGHNPGLEELVLQLSGHYEPLPTAAIAWFQLPIESWSKILDSTCAELMAVWRVKDML